VHRNFTILSMIVVLLAAGACASAGAGSASSAAKAIPNLITTAEIDSGSFRSAYDVVQRLRPNWFTKAAQAGSQTMGVSATSGTQTSGGSGLVVYLDNTRKGGIQALRDLTASGIGSLEFMDAATAQARLPGIGSSIISGAIVAHSRIGH
jgi:hypothetical protein